MKKKTIGYVVAAGALSLGIMGGAGIPAFAAASTDNSTQATEQTKKGTSYQNLDEATKQKVQTIMQEAKKQLAELGVKLPEKGKRGEMFANLDDQAKEKVKAIMEQKKSGTLTHEQVKEKLAELGVKLPEKGKRE
ncbi:hypothetical protein V7117_00870, partial [Bacillus pseudomycoides]